MANELATGSYVAAAIPTPSKVVRLLHVNVESETRALRHAFAAASRKARARFTQLLIENGSISQAEMRRATASNQES